MTISEIELATFRIVAQGLNQLRNTVPVHKQNPYLHSLSISPKIYMV
jgi:hypothetical protein